MKKILIVDDQSLNQTLIESYLRQYSNKYNDAFHVAVADNGLEALHACEREAYDLIFMDILMPKMDGIEATLRISRLLPQAIIVIVTTEDDEASQIQALRHGAKDYFVKPIQPHVFEHRLKLYCSVLNTRRESTSTIISHNLFTDDVFCFQTTYLLQNDENLAQMWESMLIRFKNGMRTNLLSDLIRFFYQIGHEMLLRKVQPQLIIEENESCYFFTLLNSKIIGAMRMERAIAACFRQVEYRYSNNTLSFRISKEEALEFEESNKTEAPVVSYMKEKERLQRYDFMDNEDLASLELRLNDLSRQFMWMGSNELNEEDVEVIVNAFERIASVLNLYPQTQTLGFAMQNLTQTLQKEITRFISMASQMAGLCNSFNNDLIVWYRSLFFDGAPSLHYMDASILSNIQMIHSFLEPEAMEDDGEGLEFF